MSLSSCVSLKIQHFFVKLPSWVNPNLPSWVKSKLNMLCINKCSNNKHVLFMFNIKKIPSHKVSLAAVKCNILRLQSASTILMNLSKFITEKILIFNILFSCFRKYQTVQHIFERATKFRLVPYRCSLGGEPKKQNIHATTTT